MTLSSDIISRMNVKDFSITKNIEKSFDLYINRPSIYYSVNFSALPGGVIPSNLIASKWSISGSKAICTPSFAGAELLTDPDLEGTYVAGKNNYLGINATGSPILLQSADAHAGTKAQSFTGTTTGANNFLYPSPSPLSTDKFYRFTSWFKRTSGTSGSTVMQVFAGTGGGYFSDFPITEPVYTKHTMSFSTWGTIGGITSRSVISHSGSPFDTVLLDDRSVKQLTTADCFMSLKSNIAIGQVEAGWTISSGNFAGVFMNLDDPSNPQNWVALMHNGCVASGVTAAQFVLLKCVSGVISSVYINSTINYIPGATIKLGKSNSTTYQVFYDGEKIGADQTITDVSVINNFYSGAISLYEGNLLANLLIWPTLLPEIYYGGGEQTGIDIVLFGDSITLADSTEPTDRGCFNWANAMLGQAFHIIYNAGIGGNSTTQMLARINADVIAKNPTWVYVEGGVNDIAADTSASVIYNNLLSIYNQCFAQGYRVIGTTLLPSQSFANSSRTAIWNTTNGSLVAYAATKDPSQFILSDIAPLYLDVASGSAVPLTNYTSDGIHPSALGAGTVGKKLYEDLNTYVTSGSYLLPQSNNNPTCLWYNSLGVSNVKMTGTGTITAPATGIAPSLFNITTGGSCVKVLYPDGKSYWEQVKLGGGTVATVLNPLGDITNGWSVGETAYAQVEIESDDDWIDATALQVYFAAFNGATELIRKSCLGHSVTGGSGSLVINPRYAILRSYPLLIPAGTTKLRTYMQFQATSGTIRISRYAIIIP